MSRRSNRSRRATGASLGFVPYVLGGLSLHLYGEANNNVIVGTKLRTASDQTQYKRHYGQGTESKRPTFLGATLLGGRQPIGTFNGSSHGLTKEAGTDIGGTTHTIIAVLNGTVAADGTSQHVLDYQTGRLVGAYQVPTAGADDTSIFTTAIFGGSDAISGAQIIVWQINGASSFVRRNAAQIGSTVNPGTPAASGPAGIMARYDAGAAYTTGTLYHLMHYSPAISIGSIQTMESQLNAYYRSVY